MCCFLCMFVHFSLLGELLEMVVLPMIFPLQDSGALFALLNYRWLLCCFVCLVYSVSQSFMYAARKSCK